MTWWWVVVADIGTALPAAPDLCSEELVRLDHARATAFAAADPQALDRVYVVPSRLADADATTIAAYRARGGRVRGVLLQVSQCRVLERTDTTIRLDVVEELGRAYVRWSDGSTSALPRDRATRRWVTLRRTAEGWRISGSQPPAPTADRGSRN